MTKVIILIIFFLLIVTGVCFWLQKTQKQSEPTKLSNNMISLPKPKLKSEVSLEEAIVKRRSQRSFEDKPLTLSQLSQILWAAQGVTDAKTGFRTAPSAGALYPLEIYVVVGERGVEDLEAGVYHYLPDGHQLEAHLEKDVQKELFTAALSQEAVLQAPVSLVIAAEYERTTAKYGERGIRYVWLEAGHVAQNIYLEAMALELGTVVLGAFTDNAVSQILQLEVNFQPLYIMPIGYTR